MLNLIPGLYSVPEGHAVIIEHFGKFEKVLSPGLNFVNPLLYSHKNLHDWQGTASKCHYLMELTEQQLETNARKCQTKDNVTVEANAVIYFKIILPKEAIYNIDVLPKSLQDVCLNVLRSKIGSYGFDELFSKRVEISQQVTSELEDKVRAWGINLKGVEIGSLNYDKELYIALQKKRIAEAEKDAKIISAESAALTVLKEADTQLKKREIELKTKQTETKAEVEMYELRALGKAKVMAIEAQASCNADTIKKDVENKFIADLASKVGNEAAVRLITASKAVEAMENLAMNPNHKVVLLPTDFKGMIKLVGQET